MLFISSNTGMLCTPLKYSPLTFLFMDLDGFGMSMS